MATLLIKIILAYTEYCIISFMYFSSHVVKLLRKVTIGENTHSTCVSSHFSTETILDLKNEAVPLTVTLKVNIIQ